LPRLSKLEGTGNVYYVDELSWSAPVFTDRREAGEILGRILARRLGRVDVVYGLAAGGVPVALEAARQLGACLDVVVVKKITYPWTTEAGFGAVAVDGSYDYDRSAASYLGYSDAKVAELAREVRERVVRRTLLVRGSTEYPVLRGLRVVLVDDGIATGYTMLVAARFLRRLGPDKLYLAAPTASIDGARFVSGEADEVVVVNIRGGPVYAVADAYVEWHDVSDEELSAYIDEAREGGLLCPWVKPRS
jgi:predicted phosphoribosyltransferase